MSTIPTITIDAIEVDFAAANPEIQAFISDVMYRIYYSPESEIRNFAAGNGSLSPRSIIDLIIQVFEEARKEILTFYPNLVNAVISVNDYFISANKLQLDTSVLVTTLVPQIYEEVSVNIRF